MSWNKQIRATLKKYGDEAAAHFGVNPTTLKRYMKTGHYPPDLIAKIIGEQMNAGNPAVTAGEMMSSGAAFQEPMMAGAPPAHENVGAHAAPEAPSRGRRQGGFAGSDARLTEIEAYLRDTVDFFLRNHNDRLARAEYTIQQLHVQHLRFAGVSSLARPAEGIEAEQVFTTNPNMGGVAAVPRGNSLDTGRAPTKEMVDAQANMTYIGGVPMPNARVAGPATQIPGQPSFGFGWNKPRPR